ncbi:LysR family transcriptional regulator [Pseudodonghicola xiamenensis]|uniref:LysR family transcriptional regulator n=1 Tax=Pseudodonghicola xiamenensis TaxID=337702 RepID=A0A8J3MEH7_9RHOB|nr:LysR family transcriptional regulator [Pseudodonghicola xiamenensis]GHG98077.1 LysR family transcriptional regulator [Pseudodonghicola xiamenensis]
MNNDIGFDLIRSFIVVAEELNFRRSAERLNLDQSALTRRIQKLEQHLGLRLLERTTREVTLTPAGESYFRDNAMLIARHDESIAAARRVAQGKEGHLRIGYMAFAATELMPRAVARFHRQVPEIDVSLRYISTQGQKLALAHDEIDVGYLIGPFDHPDFHTVLLSSELLYVVTPRNHPLLRKYTIEPRDLAGHPLILGDRRDWAEYRGRLSEIFSTEGVTLDVAFEASTTLALIGLVAAGLGITIYPESLVGFLGKSVETRPIIHPVFRSRTVLAWKRSNRSAQVRKFVEISTQLQSR